jgi:hypothetical protein
MRKLIPVVLSLGTIVVVMASLEGPANNWSAALAAVAAWWVLIGPAVVYALPGMPLTSAELEVLADDARTNPASDEWARQMVAKFARHGFIARSRFRLRGDSHFDFAQRLDNPVTGEVATLMAGWQPTPEEGPAKPVRMFVFTTEVEGGGQVLTTNSPLPSISASLPGQRAYRLPEIADALQLYSIHRRLAKQDGRQPVPVMLGDDPLAWERKGHDRSIAIQVSHGLAMRDEKAGRLKPTWKGAFRSTWLLHPFLTAFHNRRASKEASAALRVLPA